MKKGAFVAEQIVRYQEYERRQEAVIAGKKPEGEMNRSEEKRSCEAGVQEPMVELNIKTTFRVNNHTFGVNLQMTYDKS